MWQPTLTGTRLSARPLSPDDFEALFEAASDPMIWEQHPDRLRYTPERFVEYFQSGLASGGALLVTDAGGAVVGSSRFLAHVPAKSEVEIGYTFLVRRLWGGGFNRELKGLMLAHAFRYVESVLFVVGENNLRSRRAVEKLGAALEAAPRKPGSVVYRLPKHVWLGDSPKS